MAGWVIIFGLFAAAPACGVRLVNKRGDKAIVNRAASIAVENTIGQSCADISGEYFVENTSKKVVLSQTSCSGHADIGGNYTVSGTTVIGGPFGDNIGGKSSVVGLLTSKAPYTILWDSGPAFTPVQACVDISGVYTMRPTRQKIVLSQTDACKGYADIGGTYEVRGTMVVGTLFGDYGGALYNNYGSILVDSRTTALPTIFWGTGQTFTPVQLCIDISGEYFVKDTKEKVVLSQNGCYGHDENGGSYNYEVKGTMPIGGPAGDLLGSDFSVVGVVTSTAPYSILWDGGIAFTPMQACVDISGEYFVNFTRQTIVLNQTGCVGIITTGGIYQVHGTMVRASPFGTNVDRWTGSIRTDAQQLPRAIAWDSGAIFIPTDAWRPDDRESCEGSPCSASP